MEIIIIVTIVVVLVVSALVFDGEKSDEAEEESQPKGRALKRQRRDEWQPPTGSVQDPISKSSQKDNLSLIPEFSGDIQESTLEEVFVCYLFWDKEFVAPARPKFDWALQDAVEYMEEWLPLVEKEMSTFLEGDSEQQLLAMIGTRQHKFGSEMLSLKDVMESHDAEHVDVDARIRMAAARYLDSQWVVCKLKFEDLSEADQATLFLHPNDLGPKHETLLIPQAVVPGTSIEDIRLAVKNASQYDLLPF